MEEYVSKTKLHEIVDYYLKTSNGAEHYAYNIIKNEIAAMPADDVVEVKHGHWIDGLDGSCMCSECGRVYRYEAGHYCAFCGSKLDGIQVHHGDHGYETREEAIEAFHDELIWYFTEYKDSL